MTGWPFWKRRLGEQTVTFEFTAEQASALHGDLRGLLNGGEAYPVRVEQLSYRLGFDADHLHREGEASAPAAYDGATGADREGER